KDYYMCQGRWSCCGESCYYFSEEEKTWDESEESCRQLDSHLAKIDNRKEQVIVYPHVPNVIEYKINIVLQFSFYKILKRNSQKGVKPIRQSLSLIPPLRPLGQIIHLCAENLILVYPELKILQDKGKVKRKEMPHSKHHEYTGNKQDITYTEIKTAKSPQKQRIPKAKKSPVLLSEEQYFLTKKTKAEKAPFVIFCVLRTMVTMMLRFHGHILFGIANG
ncbi:hypothetical protein STEG23_036929, partial [Scotinomys teguina]